jgi:hypothetical protein
MMSNLKKNICRSHVDRSNKLIRIGQLERVQHFGPFLCVEIVRRQSGERAKNGEFSGIQFSIAFFTRLQKTIYYEYIYTVHR